MRGSTVCRFIYVCSLVFAAVAMPSRPALAGDPTPAQQAQKLMEQKKWEEADAAYAKVIEQNPYRGDWWYNYGLCQLQTGKFLDGKNAFVKAGQYGYRPADCFIQIAKAHAKLDDSGRGLKWVQSAIERGLVEQEQLLRSDADLNILRESERYQEITRLDCPADLDRDKKWKVDLDFFKERVRQVHFDLYRRVGEKHFSETMDELQRFIPNLLEYEVILRLQELLMHAGDSATYVEFPATGQYAFTQLPIDLYWFKDGIYVRAADPAYAELVGGRLISIENGDEREKHELENGARRLFSAHNDMGRMAASMEILTLPQALKWLELSDRLEAAKVRVETPDGKEASAEVKAAAYELRRRPFRQTDKIVCMNAKAQTPLPLWLKRQDEPWWYEHLKEKKLVYCQYNSAANKLFARTDDFWRGLFKFINANEVDALLLDLRLNDSGDPNLNRVLIEELIRCDKINKRGRLFVLIGRHTNHAGAAAAAEIERFCNAIFVGEPTGGGPSFVSAGRFITLPCSGVRVSVGSELWQSGYGDDERVWIAPELAAPLTSEDYRNNHDPAIAAVEAYLKPAEVK